MKRTLPCPLSDVNRVIFFKRDELTSDLICCEFSANGCHWTYHEETDEWKALVNELNALPGFMSNWFEQVSQPTFATSEFVAYERADR
jgi:allophanate hydrolase subunit 2